MIDGVAMFGRLSAGSLLNASPLGSTGGGAVSGDIASSFASALSGAARTAVGKIEGAEGLSLQALSGDADTRQVVDAVMGAEQALQSAIAIRDKIVTAYLEISRMAI